MEKISWLDKVANDEVLTGVNADSQQCQNIRCHRKWQQMTTKNVSRSKLL